MQKILVVDDAEMNRELLREMLETDHVVEMAENGEQALQKLCEYHDELAALSITQYHVLKWLYCSPKENGQRNQRNRNEIWLQGTYRI